MPKVVGAVQKNEYGSEHYQHENSNTQRQQLTGDALEVARSRALVVLHCHGRSPLRRCPRNVRSARQFIATCIAACFMRITGRHLSGDSTACDVNQSTMQNIRADSWSPDVQNIRCIKHHSKISLCIKHQMYKTSPATEFALNACEFATRTRLLAYQCRAEF